MGCAGRGTDLPSGILTGVPQEIPAERTFMMNTQSDTKPIVIALIPFQGEEREKLMQAAPGYTFIWGGDGEIAPEAWENAVAILGNPTPAQLKGCPRLRWVQLGSAGADSYCKPGVLPLEVTLTNATGSYGHAISEHMVAVTMMLYKKLHLYRDNQHASLWRDEGKVRSISTARVLVVGLGDIGGQYGMRMHQLGASVTGITRTPRSTPAYAEKMGLLADLDQLLPEADVVALALPNSPETTGLMNARRLGLMKPGAILLNVGRGSAVDTEALCDTLESGHLSGAGLDVTDPEPLPKEHRLWRIPGAIITPHISGGFHMQETWDGIFGICLENLGRFAKGDSLTCLVDRNTGYQQKHNS